MPLSERVRPGLAADPAAPSAAAQDAGCPARHCWVVDAVDRLGAPRPGLLVEWRHADGGWQGRVVYAARLRPEGWQLVEEWVSAERLSPA